jgi:signal transduction histidine kinase
MIAQRYDKEFKPKENVKEYRSLTNVLLTETRRVNNIIQQFLRFARPRKLNPTDVSSKVLLDDLAAVAGVQCKTKGIDFTIEAKVQRQLHIDVELMKQALLNILQNAVDATPKGGAIALKFYTSGNKVKFEITDTGKGIIGENIGKIFNLYYTTKPEGTGVGLSIVQQIISQHNGEIKVESKPGKVTKFTIELPTNK